MTEKRFPALRGSSLFLASPSDVSYLREVFKAVFYELNLSDLPVEELDVYAWEDKKADTPFDDLLPAQEQIPRPDDPLCRGVISFFGEWIGRPLAEDFPLDILDPLDPCREDRAYRLVHPWKPEAAKSGGFPLTGSTFEVLATLAAGRRAQKAPNVHVPPLFLRFVGPKEALAETTVGRAKWGNRHLRDKVKRDYAEDDDEMQRHLATIGKQLEQLRNFVQFLETQLGHVTNFVGDKDQAAAQLKEWLERNFGVAPEPSDRDPFKGLSHYDVEDTDVFYGRENDRRDALRAIHSLWEMPAGAKWYWVRGASGAGKSSFLRAGLIGHIVRMPSHREAYAYCVIRPNELAERGGTDGVAVPHGPLRRLLERCIVSICAGGGQAKPGNAVASHLADLDAVASEKKSEWAAGVVSRTLGDGLHRRRLLLGFDQFEEAVDMVCDGRNGHLWESLIEFVVRLSHLPGTLVLATLREDRISAMSGNPTLATLYGDSARNQCFLSLPSATDLSRVIRKPFTDRGLLLGEDLVSTLVEKMRAFSNRYVAGIDRGSLLPLISLTLERLYREVARPLIDEHRNMGASDGDDAPPTLDAQSQFERAADSAPAASKSPVLTLERASGYLEIEGAIGALAGAAVEEARKSTGPNWEDTTIGALLRRLIAWSNSADQLFSLPAADFPKDHTTAALARAMVKRRLIVQEEGTRIQLVHEAVIANWPAAQTWLEYERPLLNEIPQLLGLATKWCDATASKKALEAARNLHLPSATRLLALWYEILEGLPRDPDPEKRAVLRDFCLALLALHNQPGELVEETPKRPPHLQLAVAYQRADIVRGMLAVAPETVNLTRSDGRTALFFPAFQGNLEMIDLLLDHGANPDASDEKNWRPIHAAAVNGCVPVFARLVGAGASHGAGGAPAGIAAIHLAASNGRTPLLEYLVKVQEVDVDLRTSQGETAIIYAATANQAEAVRALVALGADMNTTLHPDREDDFGWTALHLAARDGATDAIDALIEAGVDPNCTMVNGATPLHLAAHNGNVETSRRLIAKGANPRALALNEWEANAKKIRLTLESRKTTSAFASNAKFDFTPLHMAVARGMLETVRLLLEGHADANARTGSGATALHLAAAANKPKLIELLMAKGADPELRDGAGRTPFHEALQERSFNAARVLLEAGASGDAPMRVRGSSDAVAERDRITPLHKAVGDGNEDVLRFLLGRKADLGVSDRRGWTPLHYAAAAGHDRIADRLLKRGARPEAADEAGLTALHLACRAGKTAVVTVLLTEHPMNWAGGEGGVTPLHLAAHSGSLATVVELLKAGHPADLRDPNGMTALHHAAMTGRGDCISALLGAGADPRACAMRPRLNALQFAARAGNIQGIQRLLEDKASSPDAACVDSLRPVILAMRNRQFEAVVTLLTAGAEVDARDPDIDCSLIEMYRDNVGRAESLGATDARHDGLEALFRDKGVDVGLPEIRKLEPKQAVMAHVEDTELKSVQLDSGHKRKASRRRDRARGVSSMVLQPGATGFYPEFASDDATLWTPLRGEKRAEFLKQVPSIDGQFPLDPTDTDVQRRMLPWYDRVQLVQVQNKDLSDRNIRVFYLMVDGNLYRLSGTSPPIHEVNALAPLKLTESNVCDYVRFFCFFVRGSEGPFYIAESLDDPILLRDIDSVTRGVLKGTIHPATFEGMNDKGHYLVDAVLYYSNAVFVAKMAVHPTGMVDMLDDEPIAADLPSRIDRRLG